MEIQFIDGQVITCDNKEIRGNGNRIYGNRNRIIGDGNYVEGDENTLEGDGNRMKGQRNIQRNGRVKKNVVIKNKAHTNTTTTTTTRGLNMNISNVHNVTNSFNTNSVISSGGKGGGSTYYAKNVIGSIGPNATNVFHYPKNSKGSIFVQTTYPGATGITSFPSNAYNTTIIHKGSHTKEKEEEKEEEFKLPNPLEDEEKEVVRENDDLCVICLERSRKTFILDCQHCVYCVTCTLKHVNRGTPCPICRKSIVKGVMRIYK